MLVPAWATWEDFWDLEAKGLTMCGQMTAGSWIYIGTQGILQGTYETFAEAARQHFGGTLAGKLVLSAGLGGMGGAQPLAVTMNDGVAIIVEVDPKRARRRLETRYCDVLVESLDEALAQAEEAIAAKKPLSIGLIGNAAEVLPEMVRRGITPPGHRPDFGPRPPGRLHPCRSQPGSSGCSAPVRSPGVMPGPWRAWPSTFRPCWTCRRPGQ